MNLTFNNEDLTEMVKNKVESMGFTNKTITVKFAAKKGAKTEATVTVSDTSEPVTEDTEQEESQIQ